MTHGARIANPAMMAARSQVGLRMANAASVTVHPSAAQRRARSQSSSTMGSSTLAVSSSMTAMPAWRCSRRVVRICSSTASRWARSSAEVSGGITSDPLPWGTAWRSRTLGALDYFRVDQVVRLAIEMPGPGGPAGVPGGARLVRLSLGDGAGLVVGVARRGLGGVVAEEDVGVIGRGVLEMRKLPHPLRSADALVDPVGEQARRPGHGFAGADVPHGLSGMQFHDLGLCHGQGSFPNSVKSMRARSR